MYINTDIKFHSCNILPSRDKAYQKQIAGERG